MAAPRGVAFVGSRYRMERNDRVSHNRMLEELERAALELASAQVQVIVQCSMLAALEREAEIRSRIEAATGVPALTVLGSVVAALRELGSERLALASPYTDEQNGELARFLEGEGFAVVAARGLHRTHSAEFGAEEPHVFYRLGREVAAVATEADTLLLSCGNTRTFEVLEPLEWDTGLEVVSSNQTALWNALRTVGIGEPIEGYGRLLRGAARFDSRTKFPGRTPDLRT